MTTNFSRRQFLGAAATAIAASGFSSMAGGVAAESTAADGWKWQPLSKSKYFPGTSILTHLPDDLYWENFKKAGFEGLMPNHWDITIEEARKIRLVMERHELRIHCLCRGWLAANSPDKEIVEADIKSGEKALRVAAAYGASNILLVPAMLGFGSSDTIEVPANLGGGTLKMPQPWEFEIDFDPKTLRVKSVVAGDNAPYTDYINAQNHATESSLRAIERLIPIAAHEGVIIGPENVWNGLWCTPEYFAAFTHYFDSPWVRPHFDLGNHTKFSRCEEWLKALGRSIVSMDIKDFAVTEVKGNRGGGPGDWAPIGQGTVDWKNVRKTLEEIRYSGWVSVEPAAGNLTDEEHSKFLDEHFGT